MIRLINWGNMVCRSWMVLVISLMFAVGPTVQASSPQALLVEVGVLFQRSEAMEGEEQRALLSETSDLLLRIVTDYPDSPIAAQLRGGGVALVSGPPLSLNVLVARIEEYCKRMPRFDCSIEMATRLAIGSTDRKSDRLSSVARVLWQAGRIDDALKVFGFMTEGQVQAMMDLLGEEIRRRQWEKTRDLWTLVNDLNEKDRLFEKMTIDQALLQIEATQQIRTGNLASAFETVQQIENPLNRNGLLRDLSLSLGKGGAHGKARAAARLISTESFEGAILQEMVSILTSNGHFEEAKATALSIVEPFLFGRALLAIASAHAASGLQYQAQETLKAVSETLEETFLDRDVLFREYVILRAENGFWDEAKISENVFTYTENVADEVASMLLDVLAVDFARIGMHTIAKRFFAETSGRYQKLVADNGTREINGELLREFILNQARADLMADAWETFKASGSVTRDAETLMSLISLAGDSAKRANQRIVEAKTDEEAMHAAEIIETALKILAEGELVATRLATTDTGSAVWLLINVAYAESKMGIMRFSTYTFPKALDIARQEMRPDVR